MEIVNKNIKYLRKLKNMTQEEFAKAIFIKRSSLGAYEEGRAKPNQDSLMVLGKMFNLTLEQLYTVDLGEVANEKLRNANNQNSKDPYLSGEKLRVLSVAVDRQEREQIVLVPVRARAGYALGYADSEYMADLPSFYLPMLPQGAYRAFEIEGDSMLPLKPGSFVIGEYVENFYNIRNGDTYIIVSKEDGVVYKRINNHINQDGTLTLLSDNLIYPAYTMHASNILEVWKAKAFISTNLPDANLSLDKVGSIVMELQKEVHRLKNELDTRKRPVM
jgi:DNA-binding XRE family transcriptional regulator